MNTLLRCLVCICLTCLLPVSASAQDIADRIWTGGPIFTMNDNLPRAEAIAERDGQIIAVGMTDQVMKHKGNATKMIDLGGRTLLPGFVDAHGHVFMIGMQASSGNMLPAPDGEVNDIPTLQRVLTAWAEANPTTVERAGFIIGFGYDDAQLAEQRHPTSADLDLVSTDQPVIIIHQSSHLAVFNSRALEVAGYSADTANPDGGVIRRREGSNEPNGVLEETAFFRHFLNCFKVSTLKPRRDCSRLGLS